MANIFDYLDWRGDIPLSVDPFNEVDNLVLAELAYVDFAGIVPPYVHASGSADRVESTAKKPEASAVSPEGTAEKPEIPVERPDGSVSPAETPEASAEGPEGSADKTESPAEKPESSVESLERISIRDVCRRYWEKHTPEEVEKSGTLFSKAPLLLEKLCSGARFGDMELSGYANIISSQKSEQMSAVTCFLGDGTVYVAYRGTDDTMIGWKEDFSLSFLRETAGQKSAARYLNRFLQDRESPLRVGGHSKGGNFAVYASAFCLEPVRNRIISVYTNDGPGFASEILRTREFKEILPRIRSYVPEESVFGLLFETGYESGVVKSSEKGIMQHDALSWRVLRNRFEKAEKVAESSRIIENAFEDWIRDMSIVERKEVVDIIFSTLAETGVENLSEITTDQFRSFTELLRAYWDMDGEHRRRLHQAAGRLLMSGAKSLKEELSGKVAKKLEGDQEKKTAGLLDDDPKKRAGKGPECPDPRS